MLYQNRSGDYHEKGEVFLDVNALSKDGTTAVSGYNWTEDGSIMSLSLSEKGSDQATITFMRNNGEKLPDIIKNVKYSGCDWLPKNDGVIYAVCVS